MEDDCVCEYDSTWDTESDGEEPGGESQTRRSSQDKNKSAWTLTVRVVIILDYEMLTICDEMLIFTKLSSLLRLES